MEFRLQSLNDKKISVQCEIVGVFQNRQLSSRAQALDAQSQGYLSRILAEGDLEGECGQYLLLHQVPNITATRILLVGCGSPELSLLSYKRVLTHTAQVLKSLGATTAHCDLHNLAVLGLTESVKLRLAIEIFNDKLHIEPFFKTEPPASPRLQEIIFILPESEDLESLQAALNEAQVIAMAKQWVRYVGNLPANICTPTYLADEARALAKTNSAISVEVLGEPELNSLGLNAILAVGSGSDQPSQLILLSYQGAARQEAPIVLVGKGVTFDSGGLSLKGRDHMMDMKMDMCGAATVMAALQAAATLKLPLNLHAVMPCVENLPDGHSFRPSDVITSYSGKTIEVTDTDAEGRLILCDALTYAQKHFNPEVIIDVATLTSAIVVALGHEFTGLFCNNSRLSDALVQAGRHSEDPVWPMPLSEAYHEYLKSTVADMKNLPKEMAARSCTAAAFLEKFIDSGRAWAHLDIAGTAMQKSATGRGVSLLVHYLIARACK